MKVIPFYSNKIPEYRWMSQFFPCEFTDIDGNKFISAEQYMHYKKSVLFDDHDTGEKILNTDSPITTKQLGRQVYGFDQQLWIQYRYVIVFTGNYLKFSSDERLKALLLSTKGKILVEASPVDKIWGVGMSHNDPNISNPKKWKGENLLGKVLMNVRRSLIYTR